MKLNESNPYCDCHSSKALFHPEMAYPYFFLLILTDILLSQYVFFSLAFDDKCKLHPSLLLLSFCVCCLFFSVQPPLLPLAFSLISWVYIDKYTIMHK